MIRALIGLVLVLSPLPAMADDAAYCAALSEAALRYLSNNARRGVPDAEVATAIDQCQKGNTTQGIPTLERKLRNAGFTLPQR
ncbi:MAG: hypothetical protein WCP68_18945 [Enhydrobacter sp.]